MLRVALVVKHFDKRIHVTSIMITHLLLMGQFTDRLMSLLHVAGLWVVNKVQVRCRVAGR